MEEAKQIETLEAKEGLKFAETGECIATYGRRSIVFLPKGVTPRQEVRVELTEIRPDSRGYMMYRGTPAPDVEGERWRDNNDGTASRIKTSTDWLGNVSEGDVLVTQAFGTTEGYPSQSTQTIAVWGEDLASSRVLQETTRTYPIMQEAVREGKIVRVETDQVRTETGTPIERVVSKVAVDSYLWREQRLKLAIPGTFSFQLTYTSDQDGSVTSCSETVRWDKLPAWVQDMLLSPYPVCSCGRARFDSANQDGYQKCEQCRVEEVCQRCGKTAKVTNLEGRLVCEACKPLEEQERMIERGVPFSRRQELAELAQRLMGAQCLPREVGETIVKATLDHVSDDWQRQSLERKMLGYAYYYIVEDGIYGSKFDLATLAVLTALPSASSNGLVTLIAWLSGQHRVSECESYGDFYWVTQVKGESRNPALSESRLQDLRVATWLRGSEADRQAALALYRKLSDQLGKESELVKPMAEYLFGESQCYAKAIVAAKEAKAMLAKQVGGELLLNWQVHFRHMGENDQCDGWVISPDGEEVEPHVGYRKRYMTEGVKTWKEVGPDDLALQWNRWQADRQFHESWEVVKLPVHGLTHAQRRHVGKVELHERFRGEGTGFDLTSVGTVHVAVSREKVEVPVRIWEGNRGGATVPLYCEVSGWSMQAAPHQVDGWYQIPHLYSSSGIQVEETLLPVAEAIPSASPYEVRLAQEFAEVIWAIAGERAYDILEEESTAPYGKDRRKSAMAQRVPGLDRYEAGVSFLGLSRAREVDAVLIGALAWLNSTEAPEEEPVEMNVEDVEERDGEVTEEDLLALKEKFSKR